jgi:hypothetical protein
MAESVRPYPVPDGVEPSDDFRLRAEGEEVFVYQCPVASYAILELRGEAALQVDVAFDFETAKVRPLSRGVEPHVDGRTVALRLEGPCRLSLELDNDLERPLFIFACPPEQDVPEPGEEGVRYFEGGKVHEAGLVELADGETLYIEGGAVVRGAVQAEAASDVAVRGRGILDGMTYHEGEKRARRRMMVFTECEGVSVEGVTIANSPTWSCVPVGCRGVTVRGLNIITWVVGGDGVNPVGCQEVTIEDCFLRCADDCVAVKASAYRTDAGGRDVRNIRVIGCVCWNARPGDGLEIGYETRCDSISDILFRDCDIIHVEKEGYQSGATFSIHNGDRATVSGVRYEDIRVEDSREKLIDLKVLLARYSRDPERGQIRDVHFKDIAIVDGPFPPSIIRGYDADHIIRDVTIENLTYRGRPVSNALEARMVVELAQKVRFVT